MRNRYNKIYDSRSPICFSLNCQNLDKKWLEKAKNELGECDETRAIKLRLLEERIVQDKDIPNARRDTAFLLRFLRAKKFDVDKSFRMVIAHRWVQLHILLMKYLLSIHIFRFKNTLKWKVNRKICSVFHHCWI